MNRPIIALDFKNKTEIENFLAHFPQDEQLYVKVGMEIFYKEGPQIVTWLKSLGHDIFLDLKLHDIPNTVYSAMKNIAGLGVAMTNVHAAGGMEMMKAARKGLEEGSLSANRPRLIAVTQLTSTSETEMQHDQMIQTSLIESVVHYAQITEQSGLDGVVCSALEVKEIRAMTQADFICLTPGIRPLESAVGDQKRVVTPAKAKTIGSTYIVVGRPITQSKTPYQSYLKIKKEWNDE